jgi:hypothetical protein
MKTNLTLKLDADLLREARVVAAEDGRSLSASLIDRVARLDCDTTAFDTAACGGA